MATGTTRSTCPSARAGTTAAAPTAAEAVGAIFEGFSYLAPLTITTTTTATTTTRTTTTTAAAATTTAAARNVHVHSAVGTALAWATATGPTARAAVAPVTADPAGVLTSPNTFVAGTPTRAT